MKQIATAGNTLVPALLVLEKLGFVIRIEAAEGAEQVRATRDDETYLADDPVSLLGLVKLIEERSWEWQPDDGEISAAIERYELR